MTDESSQQLLQVTFAAEWDAAAAQKAAQDAKRYASDVARVESDLQKAATNSATSIKAESVASNEAAKAASAHAKALDDVGSAAKRAATSQDFYAKAVRNQYSSSGDFLKGRSAPDDSDSGGGGGRGLSSGLRALGQVLPGQAGQAVRSVAHLERLGEILPKIGIGAEGAAAGSGVMIASLGLVAVALAATAISFEAFKKKINEAQKSLDAAVESQINYYKLIETGTTDQIQAELKNKKAEADAYRRTADDLDKNTSRLNIFGKAVVALEGIFNQGPVKVYADLQDKAKDTKSEIDKLNIALGSTEVKSNDAAKAQENLAKQTESVAKAAAKAAQAQETAKFGAAIDGQLKYFEVIATGTKETIQKALEQAQVQQKVAEEQLSYLKAQLATASGDEATALKSKIASLEQALSRSSAEVSAYTRALNDQSVAARTAAEAAKKASEELGKLYTSILADANKFNAEATKIDEQRMKDYASLSLREGQASEDRNRQMRRDAEREQRTDVKDAKIQAIKDAREIGKLEANSDFAALADLRDQKAADDQIKTIQDQYDSQEKVIKAREDGEDRHLAHTREVASIEQRTADARIAAAQTELATIKELVNQFTQLKKGFGDARYYTDQQYQDLFKVASQQAGGRAVVTDPNELKKLPKNLLNANVPVKRAGGGYLDAGQWSEVNDGWPGQRENFNGMMLPAGKGYFLPSQSGTVTNNHGGNLTIARGAIVVNGAREPGVTAAEVERRIGEWFRNVQGH